MYLGIDIGGTKTLVAVLNGDGVIKETLKFPTPNTYEQFLSGLKQALTGFKTQDFKAGGIGAPGTIERKHGKVLRFGNLSWKNVNMQHDVELITKCPMALENDAKMAGLSESRLVKDKFTRVLYVTVSTGIGYALVVDGVIDTNLGDAGGRGMEMMHNGKMTAWDDFAGGRAIVAKYGKRAEDIHDAATWQKISKTLSECLIELIAMTEPEVIVFGGSVGTYFDRYGKLLDKEIKKYALPMVTTPVLVGAQRPEEAVIFGCYDLAKQVYPHAANN